ncbi:MAG: hypothetical protein KME11_05320 [Timaviella obliquedivisa GSE-PSE-MK23-08B]|jgi:hypothetical protein|nr:hypothetical protein [Timaviella obliquedivisa GSE-PSE-MK23-08B]
MTSTSNPTFNDEQAAIGRTGHELTISGTRITIYDVINYFAAEWTLKLIGIVCIKKISVASSSFY